MKKNITLLFVFVIMFNVLFSEENKILFLSTQLSPVEEANAMRNIILKEFDGEVDFQPYSDRQIFSLMAEGQQEKPDIIGGIYGDFAALKEAKLISAVDNRLVKGDNKIVIKYNDMAKLNTDSQYFIPWMQATYIMVANKKALRFLPKGADINNLKYEELLKWGENITKETGLNKIGFPVGKNGLWHRFLQGYLYPSYTGDMISGINTPEAEKMWEEFNKIWKCVNADSLTYSKMDTPLLSEDVWIAWDHVARLVDVFKEKPNDFVAFPAPIGPKGRGYMMVLAGLAVPEKKDLTKNTEKLIKYLISEKCQILMMDTIGFFPVVEIENINTLKYKEMYKAIIQQSKSKGAIVHMPLTNLGAKSTEFNSAYIRAFSQIVLRDKDIKTVLKEEADKVNEIISGK